MTAGKTVQREIPDYLDARREEKRAVDKIWRRLLSERLDQREGAAGDGLELTRCADRICRCCQEKVSVHVAEAKEESWRAKAMALYSSVFETTDGLCGIRGRRTWVPHMSSPHSLLGQVTV